MFAPDIPAGAKQSTKTSVQTIGDLPSGSQFILHDAFDLCDRMIGQRFGDLTLDQVLHLFVQFGAQITKHLR